MNFADRHIGISGSDQEVMLREIGMNSIDELIGKTIPAGIRTDSLGTIPEGLSEYQTLQKIAQISGQNSVFQSNIGQGYYNTILPPVIQRTILENPAWYTAYTPYQAEISQGRLEMLVNFQTMITELTGLEIANGSLLDEATAAAEAMTMFYRSVPRSKKKANTFFVDSGCFQQTIEVLQTRAEPLNITIAIGDPNKDLAEVEKNEMVFGVLLQYPTAHGEVTDYSTVVAQLKESEIQVAVAADILSLALLKEPAAWGVDAVVGSTQRFGIPMGYGGPHAAYFSAKESYKRQLPGRIIGESIDREGNKAYRMSLQTREQHIRREKATSNICTSQVLLAVMATAYGVYHGPTGLKSIATAVHRQACRLNILLGELGITQSNSAFFDTLSITIDEPIRLKEIAEEAGCNFYYGPDNRVGITLDETTDDDALESIVAILCNYSGKEVVLQDTTASPLVGALSRENQYMQQDVFNQYQSEHLMTRYLKQLELKDISLVHSMIALGSCTMKLNSAASMIPLSWARLGSIHPHAPTDQVKGYHQLIDELGEYLCAITGFTGVSFEPNSGAQGEYAGLKLIRDYHKTHGSDRSIVLIPASAHGTNPASAALAGFKVVVVKCDIHGNIDTDDLAVQVEKHAEHLAGLMITYPSTHGVFEESVTEVCQLIHDNGGLVYLDGANMNAQVGYTNPGFIGADVCHLNLHKTFAIPHGGGGPGMGPICVNDTLKPFLNDLNVSAAEFGSASILVISYAYITMLGAEGLRRSTAAAILNANYLMKKLSVSYPVLYTGNNDTCAHEFIIDCRQFKQSADIGAVDVAKRLMDFGFHAPTVSFPVVGTLMIEPTESEDKAELDRFCCALLTIFEEITRVEKGEWEKGNNPLSNAPHTRMQLTSDGWKFPYSRETAAYPTEWLKEYKLWPSVARIDDAHGDRNLICTCS
ncbi:MAG: aminomethyl-transferring glycine dehydrogenase [Fibrobacterales bacterium]